MLKITDIEKIFSDIDTNYSHSKREEYLRFCGNIKHYLGLIVSSNEFISLMKIRQLNNNILKEGIISDSLYINNLTICQKPSIFVSLHLGCFNIIPAYLLSEGLKICIPVTQRVYIEQLSMYENAYSKLITHNNADLKFVNIETSSGFINLFKYVKDGYSLLIYIDGNSGIGGMERKDDKLMRIEFFNNPIFIRKGIGYLSHKLGLDIIPVYTNLSEDSKIHNLTFISSFTNYRYEKDEQIVSSLWHIFKKPIFHYFEQWEPWLYADSYYIQSEDVTHTENSYVFNSKRFAPIIKGGYYYFYDNILNNLVKMNKTTFSFLVHAYENSKILSSEEISEKISSSIKNQLISMHLLK